MSHTPATDDSWTIGQLLSWTTEWLDQRGSDSARLDAEVLLAHVLGCPRISLYTSFEDVVSLDQRKQFRDLVRRRGNGEPVAYLVGTKEFFSLNFNVSPSVLVPRPETEGLVVRVLDVCKETFSETHMPTIIDVGTGSGAIAVTLAKHLAQASISASDISEDALRQARENARQHHVDDRITFIQCDLLDDPELMRPWDIIVSNPPYVRLDEFGGLPESVRCFEPRQALIGGPTGVEIISRLVHQACACLKVGGWLLIEIGPHVHDAVQQVFANTPSLEQGPVIYDLAGQPRIVQAKRR